MISRRELFKYTAGLFAVATIPNVTMGMDISDPLQKEPLGKVVNQTESDIERIAREVWEEKTWITPTLGMKNIKFSTFLKEQALLQISLDFYFEPGVLKKGDRLHLGLQIAMEELNWIGASNGDLVRAFFRQRYEDMADVFTHDMKDM